MHGTSEARWRRIQADGWLRRAYHGDQCVSLTDDPRVAAYFADLAADCDQSSPVILQVDAAGLDTEPHSSLAWGVGECDWESETACWEDVPLSRVTLTTTHNAAPHGKAGDTAPPRTTIRKAVGEGGER